LLQLAALRTVTNHCARNRLDYYSSSYSLIYSSP
jgi:hypothetical protein